MPGETEKESLHRLSLTESSRIRKAWQATRSVPCVEIGQWGNLVGKRAIPLLARKRGINLSQAATVFRFLE
jgi:hypothetical protein